MIADRYDDALVRRLEATPLPEGGESPWPEEVRQPRHAVASPKVTLPKQLASNLAGVSFAPHYPHNLLVLKVALDTGQIERGDIRLQREPDNPHDANAIAVTWQETTLGHIPAALAARMAPEMDESPGCWEMVSLEVLITPLYPDRPGVFVRLRRVEL